MLENSSSRTTRCTVVSLADYRMRPRPLNDLPPRPPSLGGRKSCSDTVLANWIVADGAESNRFGRQNVA